MEEKRRNNDGKGHAYLFPIIGGLISMISVAGTRSCVNLKLRADELKKFQPENVQIRYVNNDTLPDLVYKTGEIYLQRKDGRFESLDSIMKHERIQTDSVYRTKQDSIKNVYMNK